MKIFNLVPQEKQFLGSIVSGALGLIGANKQNKSNEKINDQNAALQREFAKEGIQWKVADAKKAGIHPLYAIGAQTTAASPSYVGSNSTGEAWAQAGQGLGRAIDSSMDAATRLSNRLLESQIRGQELDNDLKASNLRLQTGAMSNPAFPRINGFSSGMAGDVTKTIDGLPNMPSKEMFDTPDYTYSRTASGGLAIIPSQPVKNRIEDMFIEENLWSARNHLGHFFSKPRYPSEYKLPKDMTWAWNSWSQEWKPVKKGSWGLNSFYIGRR